jgi:hypothetical protein
MTIDEATGHLRDPRKGTGSSLMRSGWLTSRYGRVSQTMVTMLVAEAVEVGVVALALIGTTT